MKKRIISVILAAAMLAALLPVAGFAAFTPIKAADFVKTAGAGINIGNTLDANAQKGLNSETSWGNPKIVKTLFTAIRAKGFDIVRLPVTWETNLSDTKNFTVTKEWLDRVEQVVDWAIEAGLYVILDTHHEDFYLLPAIAKRDKAAAVSETEALWKQIAARFKNKSEKLIFDVLNEPRERGVAAYEWQGGSAEGRAIVNECNKKALAVIRASGGNNAKRLVMLATYAASCTEAAFNDYWFPTNDAYALASVHAYVPWFFVGDPGSSETKFTDKNSVDWAFNLINNRFVKKGIPVVLGETGITNKNNLEERVKWAKYYAEKAAALHIPTVLWDNGINQPNNRNTDSFALISRTAPHNWLFPEIADAFVSALKPKTMVDMIAEYAVGITNTIDKKAADINGDGIVDLRDATLLARQNNK